MTFAVPRRSSSSAMSIWCVGARLGPVPLHRGLALAARHLRAARRRAVAAAAASAREPPGRRGARSPASAHAGGKTHEDVRGAVALARGIGEELARRDPAHPPIYTALLSQPPRFEHCTPYLAYAPDLDVRRAEADPAAAPRPGRPGFERPVVVITRRWLDLDRPAALDRLFPGASEAIVRLAHAAGREVLSRIDETMTRLGLRPGEAVSLPAPRRVDVILGVLIVALALVIRLWDLDRRSFCHPENYVPGLPVPSWVHLPPERTDVPSLAKSLLRDSHPPLYYVVMLPWVKAFGYTEWSDPASVRAARRRVGAAPLAHRAARGRPLDGARRRAAPRAPRPAGLLEPDRARVRARDLPRAALDVLALEGARGRTAPLADRLRAEHDRGALDARLLLAGRVLPDRWADAARGPDEDGAGRSSRRRPYP